VLRLDLHEDEGDRGQRASETERVRVVVRCSLDVSPVCTDAAAPMI
jgi:hypothetical protein